jgi:hypothetical protein
MIRRSILFAACLCVARSSFAAPVPVPADKAAYVGEWLGKDMRLYIHQGGQVEYKRKQPGKDLSLSIELQGFNGDNFDAGYSLVRSTFVVSKPPHREGGKMRMTVDGVELTRTE